MMNRVDEMLFQIEKYIELDSLNEAEALCFCILTLVPHSLEALFLLGTIRFRKKEWNSAIDTFMAASALSPDNPVLFNNLGLTYLEAARNGTPVDRSLFKKAEFFLQKSLSIKSDYVAAWKNLAVAYREQGDSESAFAAFTNGLSHAPDDSSLWFSLGALHTALYGFDRAIECYRKVMQLNPVDPAEVLNRIATLQCYVGKTAEAVSTFSKAVAAAPVLEQKRVYGSNLLFTMHYPFEITPEEIALAHRSWADSLSSETDRVCFENTPEPFRRLKIGYVSPDLRMNAVLFFIQPVLAAHDPTQVEVYCYANVKAPDQITKQLREQHRVVWRDIVAMDDDEVRNLVLCDKIDILVDLAGHGGDNRLALFGKKCAPLQISWIGYPDTTGLLTVDYRFTDAIADPVGMTEHLHSEQLIRLQGCFLCYHPGGDFPQSSTLPFLENRYITFGTMNNFSKITGQMLDVWCEILKHVKDSRLIIRYRGQEWGRIHQELTSQMLKHGIASERLLLMGHARSVVEQLQAYNMIDIALDTYPYNGTTTTFEELYMGVPVITLAGRSHVARVGASILKNICLDDLITGSEVEYVRKAILLSQDISRLNAMRLGLRAALMSSSLTDSITFTRNLESTYRSLWQKWCHQL